MTMSTALDVVWAGALAVAVGAAVLSVRAKKPTLHTWVPVIQLAAASSIVVARVLQVGRLPIFGAFENTIVSAWAAAVVAAGAVHLAPAGIKKDLARVLSPYVPLIIAFGALMPRTPGLMGANERALIGYLHGYSGWFGFGLLLTATAVSVTTVRAEARGHADAGLWSAYLFRLLCVGFVWLTATMVTGSLYSFALFSDWYQWQIVEVLAALVWLAYALLIHAHLLFGWKSRRLAIGVLWVGPLLLATFWIWSFFPATYHYFGGPSF